MTELLFGALAVLTAEMVFFPLLFADKLSKSLK